MKKYEVLVRETYGVVYEVEAESPQDALDKAEMGIGKVKYKEYIDHQDGTLSNVEEIK
jgi:hypothetical protein